MARVIIAVLGLVLGADPVPTKDFWAAAYEGDLEALAPERQTIGIDEFDPHQGWTPLIHAALGGHVDVLDLLLKRGAAIDRVGSDGSTALAAAAARGHMEAVDFLLARGAAVNHFEGSGQTPLNWAICRGRTEVGRRLVAAGADPSKGTRNNFTPLHEAAKHGNVDAVNYLIDAGASIHARTADGCPPMHGAAQLGQLEAVQALLDRGADPTSASWGHSALGEAIENGHDDVALVLMRAGAKLNLDLAYEETAVVEACKAGRAELARIFRDAGSGLGNWEDTDIEAVARAGYNDCLVLLTDMGAHIDDDEFADLMEDVVEKGFTGVALTLFRSQRESRKLGEDPSHDREDRILQAIANADNDALAGVLAEAPITNRPLLEAATKLAELHGLYRMNRSLLDYAPSVKDPIVAGNRRVREFVEACYKGDEAKVAQMLEDGIAATAFDPEEEESAIVQAVQRGHLGIVRMLVEHGADVNDRRELLTPIAACFSHLKDEATRQAKLEIATLLLKHGAHPQGHVKIDTWTPLLSASRSGWMPMATLLLDAGADPNAPSYRGALPIAAAAMENRVDSIRLLLDRGAKLDIPDDFGLLPLDYAKGYLHADAETTLASAGGRVSGLPLPSPLPDMVDGDPAAFESYLKRGVSPDRVDEHLHQTPLEKIVTATWLTENRAANARLLVEYGANLHEPPALLQQLVRNNQPDLARPLLRLMIEKGAPINGQTHNFDGDTALTIVARYSQDIETTKLLLELGADPRLRNDAGKSARDLALQGGNHELVKLLDEALRRWPQHNDTGSNL